MAEESDLGILVSNIISQIKYSHCRLCLQRIDENSVRFNDTVTVDASGTYGILSDVMRRLLGDEVTVEIPGIDAVCIVCLDKLLECVLFLNRCEHSTKVLNNVIDNLMDTLDVEVDLEDKNNNIYIVVDETDSKLLLVRQKEKVNTKRKEFMCFECLEEFATFKELKAHNLASHEMFTCDKCLHVTSNEFEFEEHNNSDEIFKCTSCDTYKCTQETLRQHQDKIHEVYICKECGKSFKGLNKLHAHEEKHDSKHVCPKCGKSYTTKDFFLRHVNLCLENRLDPHPMRSKIEKTYFCHQCGKGYSTSGGLRVHNRFVHGNAKHHVCKLCNKQFTAPSYLKVHMIKHTGEKNFKCKLCSGKFVSKEALLYHTRRHTGERPYSCTLCDERFVNASARAEHIKFKHIGPTLMCEICSRKFVTPTFLRQHIKKHHDPTNKLYIGRCLVPPDVPGEHNIRVKLGGLN